MNPTPQERPTSDNATLTPQIKKRIAIASGLVLVALAAIPIIDRLNPPATPQTPATTPVSSGRIIQKQAELASAPAPSVTIASAAVTASAPLNASSSHALIPGAPLAPAGGSPALVNSLDKAAAPATPPLPPLVVRPIPKTATDTPQTSSKSPSVAQTPAQAHTPEKTGTHAAQAPVSKAAIAPGTIAPATTPPAPAPAVSTAIPSKAAPIAPAGSSLGYQLQLGLFSSPNNAEKLVDDLKKRGITARTETRVQLGPFRTRAEAEESMRQLRALGYQPMLVPAGQH